MRKQLPPNLQAILDERTRSIEQELHEFQRAQRSKGPTLNVDALFRDLARGDGAGENKECLEAAAHRDGEMYSPVRPYLSFRDLTAAVGSAGGFLKMSEVQDSVDILRPWSVMARAGIQIDMGLVGDQVVPKVTQKTTPNWLPTEGSTATLTVPTLSQIALTPKTVIGALQYSLQFNRQTNAPAFAARELMRTVGTAIDQASLNGTGASGQPTGLLNTAGVQTQSGTTLNAGCATMKRKSAEANVTDESIRFISTPAVRELLEGREKATGGGKFVWEKDLVADRPASVTTDMPAAVMVCGDFGLIYFGIWGRGMFLELNPFEPANFRAGIVQARVVVSCDVAVLHPPAFIVASSIT